MANQHGLHLANLESECFIQIVVFCQNGGKTPLNNSYFRAAEVVYLPSQYRNKSASPQLSPLFMNSD